MTDVTLPDGSIASFPDTMSDADISSAVQSHLGQMSGPGRWPALLGSAAAKGALEGIGAVGDIGDLGQRLFNQGIYSPLHQLVTGRPMSAAGRAISESSPLDSASLVSAAQNAGLVNRADLQPQTTAERYGSAAAEGVGSMAPTLALGGAGLPGVVQGVAQGAGAGLGGQAASDIAPGSALAHATGSILGALGAGGGLSAANKLAGIAMGSGSTPVLDAYRNLGITPSLAGDVTGNPTLQMLQAYAAKAPGGASRVHGASETALDQWGHALEDTASSLGNAATLQDAGKALQLESNNWLNQFRGASQKAWNNVDLHIPANTPVPVTNYAQTLSDVRNAMPNAPATANTLQPSLSRDLLNSLTQDITKGPLTWQDVRAIRTRIGEKLADPQIMGDTSYTDLKRIYGALSTDLQSAAATQGPAATRAFNQASNLTSQGHDFIDNVLSGFIKGNQISPEQAATNALAGNANGGTTLQAIRDQMPKAADELAAYKLRDMGLANAGQQNATATRLSPGTFVTDAAKLSPQASDALFSANPALAQRVQDLATVGGSMKGTERFLNTSNTGTHGAAAHMMAAPVAAIEGAVRGHEFGGWPGAAAGLIGGAVAPFAPSFLAGRLTTSPLLTRAFAANPAVALQHSGMLAIPASYPAVHGLLAP